MLAPLGLSKSLRLVAVLHTNVGHNRRGVRGGLSAPLAYLFDHSFDFIAADKVLTGVLLERVSKRFGEHFVCQSVVRLSHLHLSDVLSDNGQLPVEKYLLTAHQKRDIAELLQEEMRKNENFEKYSKK